jgi:hypothetical protein
LADSPLLPIQGRLLDSAGDAIDGDRTVSFAIYGTSTGGSPVYTESQEIGFTGGNFAAYLGDVVTLDPSLFDDAPPLWLGITIQGDSEMEPRIRLGSAPTAAFAHMCGDAATLGGLAASDFAPKVHSHMAWVDANGVEVAEALPWPPQRPPTGLAQDRVIAVRDDAGLIWALDVYSGVVEPLFRGPIYHTTSNCSGQPYYEDDSSFTPPPRFVFTVGGLTGLNVVIIDTSTPTALSVCSQQTGSGCVTFPECATIPTLQASFVGAEPVFPYQFPLHPEFP